MVECYLLGTAYGYEPQYTCVRRDVAKSVLMVTVMDDMYDNHATLEEAQLFTHILERYVEDFFRFFFKWSPSSNVVV